jgi:hypothetical protein
MEYTYSDTPTKSLTIASLLSPPETMRHDSFASVNHGSMAGKSFGSVASNGEPTKMSFQPTLEAESAIPSPPISPDKVIEKEKPSQETSQVGFLPQDLPVYPVSEGGDSVTSNVPLFPHNVAAPDEVAQSAQSIDTQAVIDSHIAARGAHTAQSPTSPTKEEYGIALEVQSMQSNVLELFRKDPKAYWEREKALWATYALATQKKQQRELERRQQRLLEAKNPLKKIASTPVFKKPRKPPTPRAQRTPRSITHTLFHDPWVSTAVKEHVPAPIRAPRSPVVRSDFDKWQMIPDYSPPSAASDGKLKSDWKGQPLDLSNDPDRHLLQPDELRLASTLRLSCAAYLHSKRSIFEARLNKMRTGKDNTFRKTDAQKACKIDVNKASKLHTAFEKVGWFNPEYFREYL